MYIYIPHIFLRQLHNLDIHNQHFLHSQAITEKNKTSPFLSMPVTLTHCWSFGVTATVRFVCTCIVPADPTLKTGITLISHNDIV